MSRHIDRFPAPANPKPKKLIVLSAPRTGTYGLYQALKVLGFTPYHMVEVFANGADHARFMAEALQASAEGTFPPYTRAEFDKWFADYDIIVEMPFFTLPEIVAAYPDAKFLLTERDPDKWAKSWLQTIGPLTLQFQQFPACVFKYFHPLSRVMGQFGVLNRRLFFQSDKNDEAAYRNLVAYYKEYIAKVKSLVPPQQLKVCRLEDGFGWDDICPYLDVPTPPRTEWPSRNQPEEFFALSSDMANAGRSKLVATLTAAAAVAAPLLAVGIWYARTTGFSGSRVLPKIF